MTRPAPLSLLTHPYTRLEPLTKGAAELKARGRRPGSALVWSMAGGTRRSVTELVDRRPGGLSLLIILPPGDRITSDPEVIHHVQRGRPSGILPFHPGPSPLELAQVLRRPPTDIAAEVTDYLRWRGLGLDRETSHLIRRIIDLSAELRSISAVCRSLYLSRRALGRRLMSRGLPVPSHWLQMSRLLRVALKLQTTDAPVSSAAYELGYPDGFSVSNQMERLLGHRPSDVRQLLGWEWLLEEWLRREAEDGRLGPSVAGRVRREVQSEVARPAAMQRPPVPKRRAQVNPEPTP